MGRHGGLLPDELDVAVIEEFLVRVGIPYKVVGGTRFYDRREIKDALAYLRAIVNPTDEVSVKRIINTPKRGVGDSSIGKLTPGHRPMANRSTRPCCGLTRPVSGPPPPASKSSS